MKAKIETLNIGATSMKLWLFEFGKSKIKARSDLNGDVFTGIEIIEGGEVTKNQTYIKYDSRYLIRQRLDYTGMKKPGMVISTQKGYSPFVQDAKSLQPFKY